MMGSPMAGKVAVGTVGTKEKARPRRAKEGQDMDLVIAGTCDRVANQWTMAGGGLQTAIADGISSTINSGIRRCGQFVSGGLQTAMRLSSLLSTNG